MATESSRNVEVCQKIMSNIHAFIVVPILFLMPAPHNLDLGHLDLRSPISKFKH